MFSLEMCVVRPESVLRIRSLLVLVSWMFSPEIWAVKLESVLRLRSLVWGSLRYWFSDIPMRCFGRSSFLHPPSSSAVCPGGWFLPSPFSVSCISFIHFFLILPVIWCGRCFAVTLHIFRCFILPANCQVIFHSSLLFSFQFVFHLFSANEGLLDKSQVEQRQQHVYLRSILSLSNLFLV